VKFCGLRGSTDALRAEALGADLAGFIFHPGSPRAVAPSEAARVDSGRLVRVGVFVGQGASEILETMEEARLDLAQFHGGQTLSDALAVGPERVVRVFWPERHPAAGSLADELSAWRDAVAMFLFDAGLSGGGHGRPLGAGGGGASAATGLRFLDLAGRPSLLAGGLGPGTLGRLPDPGSFRHLAGFDMNSGVESSPGVKDHALMAEAASAAGALRVRGRGRFTREGLAAVRNSGKGPGRDARGGRDAM
jgi:phosphoribosylanthranilate isomerase